MTGDPDVHVLHTRIVTGTGGGPEKTIINSPRHLHGSGYRASVCYLHPPGDGGFDVIRRRAEAAACPLHAIVDAGAVDPRSLLALARLCRRERVAIWHGHDYKSNLFGWLLRPWCGFRLVTTVHGWVHHTTRTPLYYAIDRWSLRRYHAVVAVSSDLHDRCRSLGVTDRRLSLIENAIDTAVFRRTQPPAASPLRHRTPPGRLIIGAAGRLAPEKGFDLAIAALAQLRAVGLDVELWIAGDGDQGPALTAQAAALGLAEHVRLLGFVGDTKALFEAFDVFCLSSRREGLPNVVLEAMAMAVPVVATRCGGMVTLAAGHDDMVLVDREDPSALATALQALIAAPQRRHDLAVRARARIERDYSFTRRMAKMVAVYDRVMAANGRVH